MAGNELDHRLLEILVCPVTKGPLIFDRARQELISKSARLAYPIRDGIPVLLESEARVLDATRDPPPNSGLDASPEPPPSTPAHDADTSR